MTPEFSRPARAETIGRDNPRRVAIEADADERAALARRFGLLAVERLTADLTLRRDAVGLIVEGVVDAALVQACSVTGEAVPASLHEPLRLRFVPIGGGSADEVELSGDDLDLIEFDGGTIDLGEVAAETMALGLDPFPRAPGAADALRAAGVLSEEEVGPFGALASLRDRLGPGR